MPTNRGIVVAELSFPTTGGGSVVDANYEKLIGTAVASGLIGTASTQALVYGDSSGRQIKVRPNRAAMIRGYRWETDGAGITRSIAANGSGQPRVDLAVLRLNRADWTVTFQVIQGTPSASPVAPSPTQSEGPSGVWEFPLAVVAVANAAATITAANVTNRAAYINSWQYDGDSGAPPGTGLNARTFYAGDTARMYDNIGGSLQITGERGTYVDGAFGSGWTNGFINYQRWNGFVWMQARIQRTGANLAADTDSNLFTIPSTYRPLHDMSLVAFAGGTAMRCYLTASTGVVALVDYNVGFNLGAWITIHPATWPANNN